MAGVSEINRHVDGRFRTERADDPGQANEVLDITRGRCWLVADKPDDVGVVLGRGCRGRYADAVVS